MAGKVIHLGSIENKHNINNGTYRIIGEYFIVSVGKIVVDAHLFLKAQVSPDLIRTKNFVSDLIFQEITLYITTNELNDAISDRDTLGKIEVAGGLLCNIFFVRLHLNAVNIRNIYPK